MAQIRISFVAACCPVALFLIVGCSKSTDEHYRQHHDGKSLYQVLHKQVRSGESLENVQSLLGRGEESSPRTRAAVERFARKHETQYPDGYQESDQLVDYPIEGGWLTLQFRSGQLVNFRPGDFARYEPMRGAVPSPPATGTATAPS